MKAEERNCLYCEHYRRAKRTNYATKTYDLVDFCVCSNKPVEILDKQMASECKEFIKDWRIE